MSLNYVNHQKFDLSSLSHLYFLVKNNIERNCDDLFILEMLNFIQKCWNHIKEHDSDTKIQPDLIFF